jgi:putative membrane protein
MTGELIAAYVHFSAIIALGAVLFAEWLLLAQVGSREVRRLALLDLAYLAAALLVLASGAARLVWFGKGAAFYLHNPVFWIKLSLFAAIGLISIPPTRCFLRWRRLSEKEPFVPHREEAAYARRFVVAELLLLACVPLTAVLAARGIGMP